MVRYQPEVPLETKINKTAVRYESRLTSQIFSIPRIDLRNRFVRGHLLSGNRSHRDLVMDDQMEELCFTAIVYFNITYCLL
ncbi:hypothetical protein TNCV_3159761 [Trichonephila clavipes]|nr:hypothetical protein TNCV_3159761 [Trichonephila clavipes]